MLCKQLQNNATPLFLYSSTEHFCYSLCLRHTFPSCCFFPRAFERRVLPIVGRVCISSSHLHIFASSHPHIFSSSHLLIFTSSHLHIFSSSHLLIFTSSHPHIFTSAHLHILTSSHLLIFTSSHLHIFSSSHPHISTSSHLHILTSSHLLILTSSHLHICSSSHTSAHLHILTSSHLLLLSSCPLLLFYFSLEGAGQCQRDGTKRSPSARNEVRSPKTAKIAISTCPAQPFRTKWGSIAKKWGKIVIYKSSRATLSHEMRFDRQKLR